jgi:hypothetical protein
MGLLFEWDEAKNWRIFENTAFRSMKQQRALATRCQ